MNLVILHFPVENGLSVGIKNHVLKENWYRLNSFIQFSKQNPESFIEFIQVGTNGNNLSIEQNFARKDGDFRVGLHTTTRLLVRRS